MGVTGKREDDCRYEGCFTPGIHAVSYYYSEEHLLVKGAEYIQQGIQSGEKCFFNLDPVLHKDFFNLLTKMGVAVEEALGSGQLEQFPFLQLYEVYRSEGSEELMSVVKDMLIETWNEDFSGIRILGEANYGIWGTDPDNCFAWEHDFDQMVKQVPLKTLCLYDLTCLLQMVQQDSSFIQSIMKYHQYVYNAGANVGTDDFAKRVLEGVS